MASFYRGKGVSVTVFPGWFAEPDLEVVPERPVAQHLKERVVIHIFADILQIIVFAPWEQLKAMKW